MITITLGTIPYKFDRVIVWVDKLISQGVIQEDLFVQYGVSDISIISKYPNVNYASTVDRQEMLEAIFSSDLVIAHAGQGTVRQLALYPTSFIVLPRLAKFSEHVDDHQLLFAKSVEKLGITYCETFEELREAILNPPKPIEKSLLETPKLSEHLLNVYPPPLK